MRSFGTATYWADADFGAIITRERDIIIGRACLRCQVSFRCYLTRCARLTDERTIAMPIS